MQESRLRGDLSETSFAQFIFSFWHREKSGFLKIKKEKIEKMLYLQKSKIAVNQGLFSKKRIGELN